MADHDPSLRLGDGDRAVDGAVVDDDDVEVGRVAADVADDLADHVLLVERGDDREQP